MSTEKPTAPAMNGENNPPNYGMIHPYPTNDQPYPTNNPSYPIQNQPYPTNDQPYPTNNPPYPTNNQQYSSNLPYSQNNQSYPPVYQQYHPQSGPTNQQPYAPNPAVPPMDQNVYTSQPGANTVIIQQQPLQSEPTNVYCPNCKEMVTTNVKYKSGTRTHGAALLICCLTDGDCCALLPYCCDATKDAHHTCPKCNHYFGKKEPGL